MGKSRGQGSEFRGQGKKKRETSDVRRKKAVAGGRKGKGRGQRSEVRDKTLPPIPTGIQNTGARRKPKFNSVVKSETEGRDRGRKLQI